MVALSWAQLCSNVVHIPSIIPTSRGTKGRLLLYSCVHAFIHVCGHRACTAAPPVCQRPACGVNPMPAKAPCRRSTKNAMDY
jgi:hypothetical protein